MTNYHTIRLHGPWQADFFSSTPNQPANSPTADSPSTSAQRIKLPLVQQLWIEPEFAGVVELSRHFNWPHEDESAVFLQIDSDISWTVTVNEHPVLPFRDAERTSLSGLLKPQNLLRLRAEVAAGLQQELREVSLKIA